MFIKHEGKSSWPISKLYTALFGEQEKASQKILLGWGYTSVVECLPGMHKARFDPQPPSPYTQER